MSCGHCVFGNQNHVLRVRCVSQCETHAHFPSPLIIIPLRRHYPWPRRSKWFYPKFSVSLVSSPLPWQLCQQPQASSLKQTIHTAIVHHATPLQEGCTDNSINAGSQSLNNIDFVPINPERLQRMVNDSLCAIAYISALIVAGQNELAKWWVGPVRWETSGCCLFTGALWEAQLSPISQLRVDKLDPCPTKMAFSIIPNSTKHQIYLFWVLDLCDNGKQRGRFVLFPLSLS